MKQIRQFTAKSKTNEEVAVVFSLQFYLSIYLSIYLSADSGGGRARDVLPPTWSNFIHFFAPKSGIGSPSSGKSWICHCYLLYLLTRL